MTTTKFIYIVSIKQGLKAYLLDKPLKDDIKESYRKNGDRVTLYIRGDGESIDNALSNARLRHEQNDDFIDGLLS